MNIEHPKHRGVLFDNVCEGDVFEARGSYYMKINVPQNLNNAVDLFDGDAVHFNDVDVVYPVNCRLVIE